MSDLKVKAGQPVTAEKWNQVVDRLPGSTQGFGVGGLGMSRVEVKVLNSSGVDRDLGEPLAIDSWSGLTVSGMSQYDIPRAVEFTCVTASITNVSKLVICAEPIPDGERGMAVVSGACVIKTASSVDDKPFLMFSEISGLMVGARTGVARILSTLVDAPKYYAVAVFRDGCNLFAYQLTQDSQAPSATTAKLLDLDETPLANAIDLYDPFSLMDDQVNTETGLCYMAGDRFYALQAPCSVV